MNLEFFTDPQGVDHLRDAITGEFVENCLVDFSGRRTGGIPSGSAVTLRLGPARRSPVDGSAVPSFTTPFSQVPDVNFFRGEQHTVSFPRESAPGVILHSDGSVELRGGTLNFQAHTAIGMAVGNMTGVERLNFGGDAPPPSPDSVGQEASAEVLAARLAAARAGAAEEVVQGALGLRHGGGASDFTRSVLREGSVARSLLPPQTPSWGGAIQTLERAQAVQRRAAEILNESVPQDAQRPTGDQVRGATLDLTAAQLVPLPHDIPALPPPTMSLFEWSQALLGMPEVRACARKNWLDTVKEADPASFLDALDLLWRYCPALYCFVAAEVEAYTKTEINKLVGFVRSIKPQGPLSQAPTFQFNEDVLDDAPAPHPVTRDIVDDRVDIELRGIIACQDKPNGALSPSSGVTSASNTSLKYSSPAIS